MKQRKMNEAKKNEIYVTKRNKEKRNDYISCPAGVCWTNMEHAQNELKEQIGLVAVAAATRVAVPGVTGI